MVYLGGVGGVLLGILGTVFILVVCCWGFLRVVEVGIKNTIILSTVVTLILGTLFVIGVFREVNLDEVLNDSKQLERFYQKEDIEEVGHTGIRIVESGKVLKGEYEDIDLRRVNYEVKKDKDKKGTYEKSVYRVKDKKIMLLDEIEKYVIYVE